MLHSWLQSWAQSWANVKFAIASLVAIASLGVTADGQVAAGQKQPDKAALLAKAVEFERGLNLEAYQSFLEKRAKLAARYPGHWVVIAGGKLLPIRRLQDREGQDRKGQGRKEQSRNEKGGKTQKLQFAPAKTLAAAVAAAAAAVPDARHRFVFRIGEAGDRQYKMGVTNMTHVLGRGFYAALPGAAVLSARQLVMSGKGRRQVFALEQPSRLRVRMLHPVAHLQTVPNGPEGNREKNSAAETDRKTPSPGLRQELFLLATVFDGTGTVSRATADALDLRLWEIPGWTHIQGRSQSGKLRRSRLRLVLADTDVEVTIPVAIWQRD